MRLKKMLPLISHYKAKVILLVSEPATITNARDMLRKAAILTGAANEAGVPSNRIFVDPGLIHIASDIGQRHVKEVMEFLRLLPEATEPPAKSACWLSNISVGAPRRLRPVIEMTLLAMMAGVGLSSVFLDILQRENRRAVRLLRIFKLRDGLRGKRDRPVNRNLSNAGR